MCFKKLMKQNPKGHTLQLSNAVKVGLEDRLYCVLIIPQMRKSNSSDTLQHFKSCVGYLPKSLSIKAALLGRHHRGSSILAQSITSVRLCKVQG